MKNLFTVCVILALASAAAGQTYETTGKQRIRPTGVRPPPPTTQFERTQGAVPRGLRGGNPLQMLNPNAPAKYGTSAQNVSIDPQTGKPNGIKLFEIFF
jgi:hypothetical protein